MEAGGYTRRDFLKRSVQYSALALALSPLELIADDEDVISMKEIERLMRRETVEDILREEVRQGLIEYVRWDDEEQKTNYDELVFQKHLPRDERRAVLVMFYTDPDYYPELQDGPKREAIVFKELTKKYVDKIKFLLYNQDVGYPGEARMQKYARVRRLYDIRAPPSIAMYCTFDLVEGETPEKNDGRVKRIDILRGGPNQNLEIKKWVKSFSKFWITPNCIEFPKNGKVYRFLNSSAWNEINL